MRTIDITTILGTELKSRTSARDFAAYLRNMEIKETCVDFSRVNSVTRSFMDEFYKFAQEHKFEMVGKVIDIIALNNNNKFAYDIAFGQKKSTGEWAIYKENNEE